MAYNTGVKRGGVSISTVYVGGVRFILIRQLKKSTSDFSGREAIYKIAGLIIRL